jgi:VanZ family protein
MKKSTVLFWIGVIAYIAILYSTVPFVPALRKTLTANGNYSIYNWVYVILGLFGAVGLIFLIVKQRGWNLVISLVGLAATACIYAYTLPRLMYVVEKVHYLQYGVLAFLLIGLFRKYFDDLLLYVWILIIVYCIGLGDEAIQSLIPNRVAEIADVRLNVFSGLLGLFATVSTVPAWRPKRIFSIQTLRGIIYLLIAGIVFSCCFLWRIHGFGYQISAPTMGTFYSAFSAEKLKSLDADLSTKKNINENDKKVYENEAYRHMFQRDFYDTNKFVIKPGQYFIDWFKSQGENRVLETYYSWYLDNYKKRWVSDYPRGNPAEAGSWSSRVKSTLIYAFRAKQMLAMAGISILVLIFIQVMLLRIIRNRG